MERFGQSGEVLRMRRWVLGLLMLFGAFFTAVIISREQDVRLQRGHHKGGAAMVDAVAPLFTSDLG